MCLAGLKQCNNVTMCGVSVMDRLTPRVLGPEAHSGPPPLGLANPDLLAMPCLQHRSINSQDCVSLPKLWVQIAAPSVRPWRKGSHAATDKASLFWQLTSCCAQGTSEKWKLINAAVKAPLLQTRHGRAQLLVLQPSRVRRTLEPVVEAADL